MWLAIRYRRLQTLVLLVLSALITACAVLAPLYDRAMQQALTRLTVDAAGISATAVQVRSSSRLRVRPGARRPAAADPRTSWPGLLPESARSWFGPRIDGAGVIVARSDRTERSPVGDLQWRDGACDHVTWAAGGCPRERGDIAVSEADRTNFGLAVGSTIAVVELVDGEADARRAVERLRVTGIYRQVPDPYWSDQLLTGVSGFKESRQPYRPLHDTWLTAEGTFAVAGGPVWLDPTRSVTVNLDRSAVGVDEIVRAGGVVSAMIDRTRPQYDDLGQPIAAAGTVRAEVQSGPAGDQRRGGAGAPAGAGDRAAADVPARPARAVRARPDARGRGRAAPARGGGRPAARGRAVRRPPAGAGRAAAGRAGRGAARGRRGPGRGLRWPGGPPCREPRRSRPAPASGWRSPARRWC